MTEIPQRTMPIPVVRAWPGLPCCREYQNMEKHAYRYYFYALYCVIEELAVGLGLASFRQRDFNWCSMTAMNT